MFYLKLLYQPCLAFVFHLALFSAFSSANGEATDTADDLVTEKAPDYGPRYILEPPDRYNFLNTETGRVECTAHGVPAPTVWWETKDGNRVEDVPGLLSVLANGTLVLWPFDNEQYQSQIHSSVYRCMAANKAGVVRSRDVRVHAVVSPSYVVSLHNEYVMKGNAAVFRCRIPSHVKDYVTVRSWTKSSTLVNDGGRFSILPSGELHIRDVRKEDGFYTYKCITVHRLTGEIRSSLGAGLTVTDTVNSGAAIVHTLSSVKVQSGQKN